MKSSSIRRYINDEKFMRCGSWRDYGSKPNNRQKIIRRVRLFQRAFRRMMKNIQKQLDSFRTTLKSNSDKCRAEKEKAYLKSPYKFFGVRVPFIDKMAREFKKANEDKDPEYIFELTKRLQREMILRKRG